MAADGLSPEARALYDEYAVVFETLNELQAAVVDPRMETRAQASAGLLLHKLADHTCRHLLTEEAILRARGFPGLARRQAEDREMTRMVAEYLAGYESGEISIEADFLNALRNWLMAHIEATSRDFASECSWAGDRPVQH